MYVFLKDWATQLGGDRENGDSRPEQAKSRAQIFGPNLTAPLASLVTFLAQSVWHADFRLLHTFTAALVLFFSFVRTNYVISQWYIPSYFSIGLSTRFVNIIIILFYNVIKTGWYYFIRLSIRHPTTSHCTNRSSREVYTTI